MFRLFKRKQHEKPSITSSDKEWVEESFLWFIENFGFPSSLQPKIHLPSENKFQLKLNTQESVEKGLFFISSYWQIKNIESISLKIFDDIKSMQWNDCHIEGRIDEPAGRFHQEENIYKLEIAKSVLSSPDLFISVLSHELAHVKLLGEGLIDQSTPDLEFLTDLLVIYNGFGIFLANSCETRSLNWITRNGYLPNEVISYANALICSLMDIDIIGVQNELNSNTKSIFINDYNYIKNTKNTLLTEDNIKQSNQIFKLLNQLEDAISSSNYYDAELISFKLISFKPNNTVSYINHADTLLKQKKYIKAIEFLSKALKIDPYNYHVFNKRAYCFLQLKDFESAKVDNESSNNIESENPYLFRNYGVCHLLKNNTNKALQCFKEAYNQDNKTDLINFYLSITYKALGNKEKELYYRNQSFKQKEFNDSIFINN